MEIEHIYLLLKKTFPLKGKYVSLLRMSATTQRPHCFFAVPQTVQQHGKAGFWQ